MIHNQTASVASLASTWLHSLDRSKVETSVPTATLELWLKTLIELASPGAVGVADGASRVVLGAVTAVEQAERGRPNG